MSVTVTLTPITAQAQWVLSSVVATNTWVLSTQTSSGGVTFTAETSGATGNQFNVGSTDAITATNLAAAINASATTGITGGAVVASANGNVLTVVSHVGAIVAWSGSATFTFQWICYDGQPINIQLSLNNGGASAVSVTNMNSVLAQTLARFLMPTGLIDGLSIPASTTIVPVYPAVYKASDANTATTAGYDVLFSDGSKSTSNTVNLRVLLNYPQV